MKKPDYAHKLTDEQLAELERRIAKIYEQAAGELSETVKTYFEKFEKRDAAMQEKLKNGEITEQQYKQWRLAQIGRGKRFTAMRDKVAERYTNANETAVAYVNDATPGIYTLNRNYAAYKIEQVSDSADFTLWDEQTVKRLIVEQPDLMPYYPPKRALQRGIDLKYGKQQITGSVTSSILQGKSIPKIANDLQHRMQDMNRTSAIRTARTAVTAAQNAGRLDTYRAAQDMGIKLKKQWLATLDNRTRHAHAMLDGQTVDVDKPFKVDGYELMYPGDSSAPGYLVYNCRCTQIAEVDGEDTSSGGRRAINPETGESVLVGDMSYAEWAGWKKEQAIVKEKAELNLHSMQDCKEVLLNDIGFNFVEDSFVRNVDERLAIDCTKQLHNLEQTFGAVKKSTGSICSVSGGRATDAYVGAKVTDPTNQNLSLCPIAFNSYKSNVTETLSQIESGYIMPALKENASIYTVTHEYGHMVQNTVIKKAMEDYGLEKLKASIDYSKKTEKARLKQYKKIWADTEKRCCAEILDIAKEANVNFKLGDNISRYGRTNYAEFFAEVFANSQLGAPNELGKAMLVWLERKGLVK
jgi:SPP1 gp7 family putative phage head morphogenesis protein|nr:MAG TPA: minor capsid protein [Caudoviricetes sp.]